MVSFLTQALWKIASEAIFHNWALGESAHGLTASASFLSGSDLPLMHFSVREKLLVAPLGITARIAIR